MDEYRGLDTGRPIQAVFDITQTNSRLPDFVLGDLWAQIAASKSAETQIKSQFEKYGCETVEAAISDAFSTGRARALGGLRDLPNGRCEIEEEQDDESFWHAAITITDEEFQVDLRENPTELLAPYNTSRDGAIISCQMIFKALCDLERFANAGSFSPLVVLTDEGTIFHAGPSVPQGYYFETRIRLFDMLWQCMARALGGKLPAGTFSSIFGAVIAGLHPDTGRKFTMVEPQMGGWGATPKRDGVGAMFSTSHGDTFNCPIEICEARYGLTVVHKALRERPQQASGFAGGHGMSVLYELRGRANLSVGYTRARIPVWSLGDEPPGGKNAMHVIKASGQRQYHQFVSGEILEPGDRVLIETAHGGANRSEGIVRLK